MRRKRSFVKTWRRTERVLGPKNPHTLAAVNNLALILWERGKPGEAEPLFRQSLEETRIARGADDDGTLTVMANLGLVLRTRASAPRPNRSSVRRSRRGVGSWETTTRRRSCP